MSVSLLAATAQLLLAGVLPLSPDAGSRWPVSGRWVFPVGDARDAAQPGRDGAPGYNTTRNVGGPGGHQGADLSNRGSGGEVRAAAHGLVVVAAARDPGNGYGLHVVLAHRLPCGELVYSVYAHLARKTLAVREGEIVGPGTVLGCVGMTGDATAPHLHFEVRTPASPWERWENAGIVDPVAFVAARLPVRDRDSTWARPYLRWAEDAGLLPSQEDACAPLLRGRWRQMLAIALPPGDDADFLAGVPSERLAKSGILPGDAPIDPLEPVTWSEIADDLLRARATGLTLPAGPVTAARRRDDCGRRLGIPEPTRDLEALARRRDPPNASEACLALADLAGD